MEWRTKVVFLIFITLLASGCTLGEKVDLPASKLNAHHYTQPTFNTISLRHPEIENVIVSATEPKVDTGSKIEPPIPVPDLISIVGFNEAKLEKLFGKPSFVRRDATALLWQYRDESCTLDLFLYKHGHDYNAEYFEIRDRDTSIDSDENCLRAIIKKNLSNT